MQRQAQPHGRPQNGVRQAATAGLQVATARLEPQPEVLTPRGAVSAWLHKRGQGRFSDAVCKLFGQTDEAPSEWAHTLERMAESGVLEDLLAALEPEVTAQPFAQQARRAQSTPRPSRRVESPPRPRVVAFADEPRPNAGPRSASGPGEPKRDSQQQAPPRKADEMSEAGRRRALAKENARLQKQPSAKGGSAAAKQAAADRAEERKAFVQAEKERIAAQTTKQSNGRQKPQGQQKLQGQQKARPSSGPAGGAEGARQVQRAQSVGPEPEPEPEPRAKPGSARHGAASGDKTGQQPQPRANGRAAQPTKAAASGANGRRKNNGVSKDDRLKQDFLDGIDQTPTNGKTNGKTNNKPNKANGLANAPANSHPGKPGQQPAAGNGTPRSRAPQSSRAKSTPRPSRTPPAATGTQRVYAANDVRNKSNQRMTTPRPAAANGAVAPRASTSPQRSRQARAKSTPRQRTTPQPAPNRQAAQALLKRLNPQHNGSPATANPAKLPAKVGADPATVHVSNISWDSTELQLEKALAVFGPVKAVEIVHKKIRSPSYAFVEFRNAGSARKAIAAAGDGKVTLDKRALRVEAVRGPRAAQQTKAKGQQTKTQASARDSRHAQVRGGAARETSPRRERGSKGSDRSTRAKSTPRERREAGKARAAAAVADLVGKVSAHSSERADQAAVSAGGSASTAEQRLEATQMMRTAALSGDRVSLKAAIAWAEHSPIKAHLQQDLAMAKAKLLRMG